MDVDGITSTLGSMRRRYSYSTNAATGTSIQESLLVGGTSRYVLTLAWLGRSSGRHQAWAMLGVEKAACI